MNLSIRKFFEIEPDASGDAKAWFWLGTMALLLMLLAQWVAES